VQQLAGGGWVLEHSGVVGIPTGVNPRRVECGFRCFNSNGCPQRNNVGDVIALCQNSTGLESVTVGGGTNVVGWNDAAAVRVITGDPCASGHVAASGFLKTTSPANYSNGGWALSSSLSTQNLNKGDATDRWNKGVFCAAPRCQTSFIKRTMCLPTDQIGAGDHFPMPEVAIRDVAGQNWQATNHRFSVTCPSGKLLVGGGCKSDPGKSIIAVASFPEANGWTCDFSCWMGTPSCDGSPHSLKVHAICAECNLQECRSATTGTPSVSLAATTGSLSSTTGTTTSGVGTTSNAVTVSTTATATTGRVLPPHEFVTNSAFANTPLTVLSSLALFPFLLRLG
jgi:hypothetical protein